MIPVRADILDVISFHAQIVILAPNLTTLTCVCQFRHDRIGEANFETVSEAITSGESSSAPALRIAARAGREAESEARASSTEPARRRAWTSRSESN